jgi:Major Facilitator Superfamily
MTHNILNSAAKRDDPSPESPTPGVPRVAQPGARRAGKLPSRAAYVLMTSIIGLALFTSGTPSPLYETYRALWGFSSVVLTLVYATYALGVLASLLLAGAISDQVGRRPVLIVALAALMLTTVVFMAADSVAWLFVARAVQGVATGLALGAAGAALLDLHPRRDPSAVGLANGVASTTGIALGVLVSALIVEVLPAPRVLPYVAAFVLLAIAFLGALAVPEPVQSRSRLRLTPQRPNVPRAARPAFMLAALGVMSSWSIAGLFLALGPQALGHTLSLQRPSRRRSQRIRPRSARLTGADRIPAYHAVERSSKRLVGPRRRRAGNRCRNVHRLRSALPRRQRHSGSRLRRGVPRRAESAVGVHPRRTSRPGHVGLLPRGLLLALPAGDPGRSPGRTPGGQANLRDLRQRHCCHRGGRRRPSTMHPPDA